MERDPEFFGETELTLVYIAKKLKEALVLEKLLTNAEIDYLVEPDTYRGGFVFVSERVGAFFYVAPEAEERTRELMQAKGYKPYSQ
jgi:prenyltransferase beta subunit